MDEKLPCQKRGEQIKTLFQRVDEMDNIRDFMHSLDKNAAIQTTMLEHIIEHNMRQDERADRQDKRADKQDEIMSAMSNNLTELNDEVRHVKEEVEVVKTIQEDNEDMHNIDLRSIEKDRYINRIIKYGIPIGISATILVKLLESL